uniref:Uncharacterized protein n=1 Tax=Setaria digitata TaxID=48799 RepID=A0A915Q101_9BILA
MKLKESESKQVAIAELAKEILEKDRDKDQRISTLGEENLQQSRDISRLQALLKTRDEYLVDAENEVTKLRGEIIEINATKSAHLVELEQKISSLRAEINEKNGILFDQEQEIQELKKTVASKERELEKAAKMPVISVKQTGDTFSDSERAKLTEKMVELEMERNLMLDEISQLQDKIVMINQNLDNERSHVEELSMICSGYKQNVEELKNRCNELTSELNEYRSKTKIAKKGNSMFFEFVDERVKLEKDLLKLKSQNDFFASQKEVYELELNELRHELMLALTLRTDDRLVGGDTSASQLEISRLRTELMKLNAKLLEKCKEKAQIETEPVSNYTEIVDLKDYAFNSLKLSPALQTVFDLMPNLNFMMKTKRSVILNIFSCREEVRMLTLKLEKAEKERIEYFDKLRECEHRYSEECNRSRKMLNELECLKRRLLLEQKKNSNNLLIKALKPSNEVLSEQIADFGESDTHRTDPNVQTISGMQSSCNISDCSSTSTRQPLKPLREEENMNVPAELETGPTGSISDVNQNEALPLLTEIKTQTDTNLKEMPVEKRLRFQLSNDGLSQSVDGETKSVYPGRRKPKRRVIRRVCEASRL